MSSGKIEDLPPLTRAELAVLGTVTVVPQPPRPQLTEEQIEWDKLCDDVAKRNGPMHSCGDFPNDPCGACGDDITLKKINYAR
jgi:hypothetical protein